MPLPEDLPDSENCQPVIEDVEQRSQNATWVKGRKSVCVGGSSQCSHSLFNSII